MNLSCTQVLLFCMCWVRFFVANLDTLFMPYQCAMCWNASYIKQYRDILSCHSTKSLAASCIGVGKYVVNLVGSFVLSLKPRGKRQSRCVLL